MNYFELIEKWAEDRNLIEGALPKKQVLKLIEELGELGGGMAKGKEDIIKDSIGDIAVVLTILAKQTSFPISFQDTFLISDPDIHLTRIFGKLSLQASWSVGEAQLPVETAQYYLDSIMADLGSLASYYGYSLEESVSAAWEEIKDRKGKMIDGVFVKEARPMTIFAEEKTDYLKQPMFFGKPLNVARFDECKYQDEIDTDLTVKELGFFWRPEEVDISKDRIDFNEKLVPHEKHIFTSNLKYQTLLDSIQTRGIGAAFSKIVSLPELENWLVTWAFYESIHSRSYTHIIRNLYPNPGTIFDDIVINPNIVERTKAVTDNYDRFIRNVDIWSLFGEGTFLIGQETTPAANQEGEVVSRFLPVDQFDISMPQMMADCYYLLADINCLEALRFYVSFACSFAFNERELMEGNAKIIKFICRDEQLHKCGTTWMINQLRSGKEGQEWAKIAREQDKRIPNLVRMAVEQEYNWAKYLFKDGAMPGINLESMGKYMQFLADILLEQMGLAPIFGVKKNPKPWMEHYTNTGNVQVAPQEVEISSYLVGSLSSTSAADFKGFSL